MPGNDYTGKKYYSIREVAGFIEVNPSLLRYWERNLPGIKPRKNKKGTRFYTEPDIEYLRYIHHLVKVKGLTLKGAAKVLRENRKKKNPEQQIEKSLKNIRSFLVNLKSSLSNKQNPASSDKE